MKSYPQTTFEQDTAKLERELRRFKKITLPCGANATVDDAIKPETIAALDEMCRTAMSHVTSQKVQNGYTADGTQPKTEWACNRCVYAWDGNGGWCPSCGQEATHGKAFK